MLVSFDTAQNADLQVPTGGSVEPCIAAMQSYVCECVCEWRWTLLSVLCANKVEKQYICADYLQITDNQLSDTSANFFFFFQSSLSLAAGMGMEGNLWQRGHLPGENDMTPIVNSGRLFSSERAGKAILEQQKSKTKV